MKYKAAIFDLDGTLLDTLDDLADAMNDALRQEGLSTHPVDRYKLMIGNGVTNLVKRSLPADRQDLLEAVLKNMRQNYAKNALSKTKIYPGLADVISKLVANGLKLAVLTNKDQTFAGHIVEHYFGKGMFALTWGAMPSRPIKPDPAALVQLLQQLKVGPGEAVFIGDSGVDMDVAKAAGVDSIGVTWGFRGREELIAHHAGAIIDRPEELWQVMTL